MSQSRRHFLLSSGALIGAAAINPGSALAQRAKRPTLVGGTFPEGIMSGDPSRSGATLWTRVAGLEAPGTVQVEIALDRGFRKVVATQNVKTNESIGHAVKVKVDGLDPLERYYYRFSTRGGESPVGRFQTAPPPGSDEKVRFACISCQEFTFGYYNAHKLIAKEDVDFVINLGDYVYSDVAIDPPNGVRSLPLQVAEQSFSAQSQLEYRARYSAYRTDPNLRAMQAKFPVISTWDDHEVQNDYAGGDPAGGGATGDPYTAERKAGAYRAFFECMPTFPIGTSRLYHRSSFGDAMDLFVLDERQYRAAQPKGPPVQNEPRDFLGRQQQAFLLSGMRKSKAAWKVIANQVVIMPLRTETNEPDGFDAWQGYPVEREALLNVVKQVEDTVFVTGDYHAFLAGDVQTASGETVAAEFVGGSISSSTEGEVLSIVRRPGYGTPDDPTYPPGLLEQRRANMPWLSDMDYSRHGYFVCEAGPKAFKTTFKKLQTIRQQSTALSERRSFTVERGTPGIK